MPSPCLPSGNLCHLRGDSAGAPIPHRSRGVRTFESRGIQTPFVMSRGRPLHPDWFVDGGEPIALGFPADELDDSPHPLGFYGKLIHENCQCTRILMKEGFAKTRDPGCLFEFGCKGPLTYADCPTRLWNTGRSPCVGSGGRLPRMRPPEFPDLLSPFLCESRPIEPPASNREEAEMGTIVITVTRKEDISRSDGRWKWRRERRPKLRDAFPGFELILRGRDPRDALRHPTDLRVCNSAMPWASTLIWTAPSVWPAEVWTMDGLCTTWPQVSTWCRITFFIWSPGRSGLCGCDKSPVCGSDAD